MSSLTINPAVEIDHIPIWKTQLTDFNYDRKFLEQDKLWKTNALSKESYTLYNKERLDFIPESSNEISNWLEKFKKNNDIFNLLGSLLDSELNKKYVYSEYPLEFKDTTIETFLRRNCQLIYRVINDAPKYSMYKHYDNRSVFGNFFINLCDNPDVATEFYNTGTTLNTDVLDDNSGIFYKGPTTCCDGLFFMNSYHTWHGVNNRSDKNRFILNIVVYFNELTY